MESPQRRDNAGETAMMLVGTLISVLQDKGIVTAGELEQLLTLFLSGDVPPDQRDYTVNAIALLQRLAPGR